MHPMTIIFHSPLEENAPADEQDVLEEAAFFKSGLESLGYVVQVMPFPYDLQQVGEILDKLKPPLVVNLTETLFGDGRLVHLAPAIFDHFGIPYTGCSSEAIYLTSHKILSKRLMAAHGIPTPGYFDHESLMDQDTKIPDKQYMIKSVWEHASYGLDERKKLLFRGRDELIPGFLDLAKSAGQYFAEEYIHGREFNVSVLGTSRGPKVLPVAEMRFDYPDDKPRIVGYRAKWDTGSFEYHHTHRRFLGENEETDIQEVLHQSCLQCWHAFQLSGYARVDFRIDMQGRAYVLEVNANPCISNDAGFVAAALKANMTASDLVACIIDDTMAEKNTIGS